jgi:hypothetical protein
MKINKILFLIIVIQFLLIAGQSIIFKYKEISNIYIFKSLLSDYSENFDLAAIRDYGFRSRAKSYCWYYNNMYERYKDNFLWSSLCEIVEKNYKSFD